MPVGIITDSTSYIPDAMCRSLGITKVSLGVVLDGVVSRELDMHDGEFYPAMEAASAFPSSSQPTPAELDAAFRVVLERGDDLLGVFISSEMSGTYETALTVASMLANEFPGSRIEMLDSRSNSMQLGFAALSAARAAAAGATIEASTDAACETMARTRFLFTPHDLAYLRAGGRIGGASALLGALLQIRPVLTVEDGVTQPFDKVRTKGRALARIAEAFAADVAEHGLRDAVVHHIADEATGRALAVRIETIAGREVPLIPIGPVVGLHVGPGTAAVVYETEAPLRALA